MAGAAVATPRVVAIAVAMRAESFMVRVRVVLGCARSNINKESSWEKGRLDSNFLTEFSRVRRRVSKSAYVKCYFCK
jgi:hypothetical protein